MTDQLIRRPAARNPAALRPDSVVAAVAVVVAVAPAVAVVVVVVLLVVMVVAVVVVVVVVAVGAATAHDADQVLIVQDTQGLLGQSDRPSHGQPPWLVLGPLSLQIAAEPRFSYRPLITRSCSVLGLRMECARDADKSVIDAMGRGTGHDRR